MEYEEWEAQVPEEIRQDPLWQMEAYRPALYLYDLAWEDCQRLMRDPRGRAIAEQLIRSAGSISANMKRAMAVAWAANTPSSWAIPSAPPGRRAAGIIVAGGSWTRKRSDIAIVS